MNFIQRIVKWFSTERSDKSPLKPISRPHAEKELYMDNEDLGFC